MNRILCFCLIFAVTFVPLTYAGKKRQPSAGQVLGRFDRDQNGKVDGKESGRLKTVYAALSSLDKDHNGQLSDDEIAAASVEQSERKGSKGGKGQK